MHGRFCRFSGMQFLGGSIGYRVVEHLPITSNFAKVQLGNMCSLDNRALNSHALQE